MTKSEGSAKPVLIAGGGIGGLAAAYALAQVGRPSHVLEQGKEFGEVGAGIQLGPNVFKMFERARADRRDHRRSRSFPTTSS